MTTGATHRRQATAVAAIMLLLPGGATLSASARPDPGKAITTARAGYSNRCPLERVGTQYVRCDNLTGNGVAAPVWIPETWRESGIATTTRGSASLAPPRMRLALFPEDPGYARMVKVVATVTDQATHVPAKGTVTFIADGLKPTELPLDRAGKATLVMSVRGLPSVSVLAVYSGDATHDRGADRLAMDLLPDRMP